MTHVNAGDNMNAPKAILSAVYEGTQVPMDTAIRIESKYFAKVVADPQAGNMIRSLFVSKQAAEKGARRPKGRGAGMPTKKIGMLGAGLMGAGVAMVTAQAGIEVVLLDRDLAAAEKGKQYTADRLAKKRMDPAKAQAILDRIKPTADYADLAGCDLIIEAVFETREIKADVTKATEAVVGPGVIFGSNTSTLPITGLAEGVEQAGQLHRHPLLLAGGKDAAGRNHRRQGNRARSHRQGTRLCRGDPQDADRRQ
jgi:3-hydroxyacyl-CoA dehydrogenase / enoyl-CoA hydratase / 3-hydroxybutyryl-CoA epimerase